MGKVVNTGKNRTAIDLVKGHVWWVVLGRCKFTGGTDWQWPGEPGAPVVPDEDVTLVWPDEDIQPDDPQVGFKKAATVCVVKPDVTGPILVNGVTYSVSTDPQDSHIYWKFNIDPEDFISGPVGSDIEGYRRISIRSDSIPSFNFTNKEAMREADLDARGTLFWYSNVEVQQRPVPPAPLVERQVIKLILQPSFVI